MSLELVYPFFKKHKSKILLGMAALLIVDVFQLFIPILVKKAIDYIAFGNSDIYVVVKFSLIIIFSGFVITFLRYWWRVFLIGTSRYIEKGIREMLFKHVTSLDSNFFDRVRTGDIMAHATSDINHIRMAFGIGIVALTDAVLLGSATIIFMFYLNFKLTLLALIPMPVIVIITRVLGQKMHDFHSTAQESYSALTEYIRESFFGIRIIKVFNFEKSINQRTVTASQDYYEKNLKRAAITAIIRPLMVLFLNMSLFIITFYGGYLVMDGAISAGDLVAFMQYLNLLAWPVIALGWMTNLMQRGIASIKRINNILESSSEVMESEKPLDIGELKGEIEFKNISFSYEKGKRLFKNLNFKISEGEKIGITGPPGSGKSTLVFLISRLYDPDSGSVIIHGKNIKDLKFSNLRSNISYMPQEAFLFSGTIRDNILMGLKEDDKILEKILEKTKLKSTIESMPLGLDTIVGERGITLSGGQKQRIALARTIIRKNNIVILDDPVSQVDTDTSLNIINGLKKDFQNNTLIIVSHRISAISGSDRIIIMKNGEIEDSGNHDYLMENSDFYRESYNIQLFEDENE